ncbi:hypothetical protein LWI28_006898 [Acer negundo]|uniref:Pre-mRNA-splicing factor Syf1/CRNKL1-like C-terminal HAT-repeats domain-containing protein n=1 Tax=Acer negundo TaxID=4023 RepID=A0AAD5JLZ6_ACENE|nr:hypothetical protein LWI28_006898 [Acer negundo]KAK4856005.1 hypothetical protein QYF36_013167 [Acer negundo]
MEELIEKYPAIDPEDESVQEIMEALRLKFRAVQLERLLRDKDKYIEIELQLCNFDRCRKLYEKYLEWSPENCYAWSKYAELERSLAETDRARAIFELAIAQPALDMPELLWKKVNLRNQENCIRDS